MNTSSIQGRRLSRRASTLSAVLCAATLLVPCGRVLGQFQAQRISSVADVIDQWNAEQHLYVKGDLGVDNRRYADLERWLSEHGPHWTVVLMQDAAGE